MQLPEIMTSTEKTPVNQKTNRKELNTHGTKMTIHSPLKWFILVLAIFIGISLFVNSVYAETLSDASAGRNIYVSGMTYNPAVFFTGDKGSVTVYVTNGNANQTVSVNHASFGDNNIQRTSGTYDASSTIGPLQTRSYTFSVIANSNDGIYYPTFSLSYFGALSLWQQADVQVDNTPLVLSVIDKPDTFSQGRKDTIYVQIANPRKNDVNNVILEVSGVYAVIMPSKNYIGKLAPGESTEVNFTITPDQPTALELNVDYNNGDNVHNVTTAIPVTFGIDKRNANPIITNIKVIKENGIYDVTGDVTNAGLLTANGVTVTSLPPALPLDPFRSYIIGALKQDDFGSFELTFSTDNSTTTVPLQLSYKDKDGNVITSQQNVSLAEASASTQNMAQPGFLRIIGIVIIIALICGGYLYLKKRKNQ
jgi:hypothetical protein